jgi:hypothetical protein
MRKFDPWPVFFKREWNRNWPFLAGFTTTGAIITKYTLSLTGVRTLFDLSLSLGRQGQSQKVVLEVPFFQCVMNWYIFFF